MKRLSFDSILTSRPSLSGLKKGLWLVREKVHAANTRLVIFSQNTRGPFKTSRYNERRSIDEYYGKTVVRPHDRTRCPLVR